MKHRQKHARRSGLSPAYRRIFEHLDAAVEKNSRPDNYEKIVQKVTSHSRRTKSSK